MVTKAMNQKPPCEGPFRSGKISDALTTWERGGLVAIPTETVIGLGAPVHDEELIKKIFSYKERPFYDPLIVHVHNEVQAKGYAKSWGPLHERLAHAFWPGPLTLVVEKNNLISDLITSGLNTVGLRVPACKKTRELIKACGHGVAAPSANKFTKTSPTKTQHVEKQFIGYDLCLLQEDDPDFFHHQVGIESTIVSIQGNTLSLLRPGAITPTDIKNALEGETFTWTEGKTAFEEKETQVLAPGQLPVHYRPSYQLDLVEEDDLALFWQEMSQKGFSRDLWDVINLESDPGITAREIYLLMHRDLPAGKTRRVFVLPKGRVALPEKQKELWQSILNRLTKAASLFEASQN